MEFIYETLREIFALTAISISCYIINFYTNKYFYKSNSKKDKLGEACIGQRRTGIQKRWWSVKGKTPKEVTYCEYCFNNNCSSEELYFVGELPNCNCDCIEDHPKLEGLTCDDCKGNMLEIATLGRCSNCNCQIPSCSDHLCVVCSVKLNKCEICGKDI